MSRRGSRRGSGLAKIFGDAGVVLSSHRLVFDNRLAQRPIRSDELVPIAAEISDQRCPRLMVWRLAGAVILSEILMLHSLSPRAANSANGFGALVAARAYAKGSENATSQIR
jgi:hypothetical protein